jgi:hypothetical protein
MRRWAGHVASMGEMRNAYRVWFGKPKLKRLLGRPRCIWEDNIKKDFKEIGLEGIDWIHLAQDRDRFPAFVITVMKFRAP